MIEGLSKTDSDVDHTISAQVNQVLLEVSDYDGFYEIMFVVWKLTEVTEDTLDHSHKSLPVVVSIALLEKLHLFNESNEEIIVFTADEVVQDVGGGLATGCLSHMGNLVETELKELWCVVLI